MRRLIAVLFSAALAATAFAGLSGATTSLAKAGDSGSPGNKGLCNAYEHNNENGKTHGQAFIRLAATAGDYDGDGDRDAADVLGYCADNVEATGKPA